MRENQKQKPRGFIKAEIFHYKDVLEYGSEKALTELGLIRDTSFHFFTPFNH
ncbi:MAG: DUF933 domain-containing protein [Candidatus Marinimicrobia bacterium]|nr:DUF933 domain-containing protein [Candidatus Neomarinimicrobiota bacterium]MBT6797587.1 DUF933 domain-containing protein [Candidatus Neomarinimicrobiota bacterium]